MHHTPDGYWITANGPKPDGLIASAVSYQSFVGNLASSAVVRAWGCNSYSMVSEMSTYQISAIGFYGAVYVGVCGAFACTPPVVWP